jgi:ATP-dependent DNA helicase RecG
LPRSRRAARPIVYPIIEESANQDLQSAKAEFERLKTSVFPDIKVDLIHGAMSGKAKSAVMKDFAAGTAKILVATQVIEVGIDVPNATVMVIQNADRFGLASLHQLRGRIGRGAAESTCCLVAEPKTPQAQRRVDTMVATADGFRIGEEDLKLRGPGELLGTAQHGELSLQVADLFKDAELLAQARADADEVLAADPKLLRTKCLAQASPASTLPRPLELDRPRLGGAVAGIRARISRHAMLH